MANSGAIRAGKAYVELFADGSKLAAGLRAASAKLKAFGDGVRNMGLKLMGVGSAIMTPLVGAAAAFAGTGANLYRLSQRTGMTAEELSALGYAANMSEVDMDALALGVTRMQKTLAAAAGGSKEAKAALDGIGLSAAEMMKLSPSEQLKAIADRLAGIQDPAIRAATALKIFGRGGVALLPMVKDGAAGIEALEKRARELGLVISSDDAKAAKDFSDVLKELWAVIKQGVFAVGAALAPVLKGCAEWIAKVVVRVTQWIKTHKEVVQRVLITAAAVVGLGAALVVLGTTIKLLGVALGGLMTIWKVFSTVISLVGTLLSALLTPIGAIIAAVAVVGGYFLYASGAMGKATTWLGERFAELKADAEKAYQGIADALAAGDIGLAVKILWLTIKLEWQKGINWLLEKWYIFKAAFMEIALKAWYGALAGITIVWGALERVWITVTKGLAEVWQVLINGMQAAWEIGTNWLAKRWIDVMRLMGDLTKEEADQAQKNLDSLSGAKLAKIGQQFEDKYNQLEAERKAALAESKAEETATLAGLGGDYEKAEADRKAKLAQEITDLDAALAKTKAEWEAAIKKAHDERAAKESQGPEKLKPPPKFDAGALEAVTKKTIEVSGTFSSSAAWGLAVGRSLAERTAKGIESIDKNTKKMADELEDADGPVFV